MGKKKRDPSKGGADAHSSETATGANSASGLESPSSNDPDQAADQHDLAGGAIEVPEPEAFASQEPVADDTGGQPAYGLKFVVGIGASAGGLEALKALVSSIPDNAQTSYVVAQHLSPQHDSMLTEILGRETRLTVVEARDGELILPNQIIITPPNSDVTVAGQRVRLSAPHVVRGAKPSIDLFFESLAREYSEKAVGVILSGTGSDGARGMQAVKAAGGFTFAQEPETAKYDGMPRAAISTGCVDRILPPSRLARELTTITQFRESSPLGAVDEKEQQVVSILEEVRRATGADFLDYKRSTVIRRIEARMAATSQWTLADYASYITDTRDEPARLRHNILISVTSFFRDPDAFEALRTAVAEQLKDRSGTKPYRVWVPGCATGEEAFTLAIILDQVAPKLKVQIFATDLDESIMETTRKATYPETAVINLPDGVLEKYFTDLGKGYQVRRHIRESVVFASHNLIDDPSFLHLDLVSCRNLLIYFQPVLQQRVLQIFHQSLARSGLLFLGKSESIHDHKPALFKELDRRHRVFLRRSEVTTRPVATPRHSSLLRPMSNVEMRRTEAEARTNYLRESLLNAFVPPSVLVDSDSQVLESEGEVRSLLSLNPGRPDFSLLSLVPDELQMQLRAQLFRARREQQLQMGTAIECDVAGSAVLFRTEVRPLEDPNTAEQLFLVSFHREIPKSESDLQEFDERTADSSYVKDLEQELETVREHLQTVVEELETSNEELQSLNEELQSSNEELQASNEEMQASNEELESSNEEMQSTNEELITLNGELEQKSRALEASLDDLENIQTSVGAPVATVDRNLLLKRMNKAMGEVFDIGEEAFGQPLSLQRWNIGLSDLHQRMHYVMASGEVYDRELVVGERHFMLQISPYHSDNNIAGAVLMFHDVTELQQTARALSEYERQFRDMVENSLQGILIHADDQPLFVNQAFCNVLGFTTPAQFLATQSVQTLFPEPDFEAVREARDSATGEPRQVRVITRNGDTVTAILIEQRLLWQKRNAWQTTLIDVSERVRVEEQTRQAQRLEVLGQLTGGVAHDFNNLLAVIQGSAELIESRVGDQAGANVGPILHSIERGRELTQRLLSYARMQPLSPHSFDLNDHLRSIVPLLARTLGGEVEVRLELSDAHVVCHADSGELETALLNLLLNSKDAMPGGGVISLHTTSRKVAADEVCEVDLDPGSYVHLEVRDQGSGISAAVLDHIFDPFVTSNETGRGSGLGLSMVYGFVKQSGGDVRVMDTSAKGTSVGLWLPAGEATSLEQQDFVTSARPITGRILMVEDDASVRRVVEQILSRDGLSVEAVDSGERALESLTHNRFDYLLTDIRLARSISGLQLVRQAKERFPMLKVLLMSGFPSEQLDDPLLSQMRLLKKPFSSEDLLEALRALG
ncbi:MAG: chemotaxis protein CheB [Pseudomonadales bacterium]